MKRFIEGFKNILYDSMDYIIMLAIVISVVSVIGWRLDILFAKDTPPMDDEIISAEVIIPDEDRNSDSSEDVAAETEEEKPGEDKEEKPKKETKEEAKKEKPEKVDEDSSQSININIPDGSLPSKIGSILEESGLVSSKNEFVQKAQDMNLDRALRSGKYTFDKNSSLEDIIRKIARK